MSLGPVPPYTNPPIMPGYYQPSVFTIANIALGTMTTVTTTKNHNYVIGQQLRLHIPSQYGCVSLNGAQGNVVSILSPSEVITTIYSVGVTPFIQNPANPNLTVPQVCAIGDVNSGPLNAMGRINNATTIPGAFIDISPL